MQEIRKKDAVYRRKVADLSLYKRHLRHVQTPPVRGTNADL